MADLAPNPNLAVDAGEVRAQLGRILSSRPFGAAPSLARFLRYIVEETIQGRSDVLKEYTLGVQIFDRGEQFDTRLDPIVRVQARNLRIKLQRYYAEAGAHDAVLIDLPKGCYVPMFRERRPVSESELQAVVEMPPPSVVAAPVPEVNLPLRGPAIHIPAWFAAAACLVLLLLAGSAYLFHQRQQGVVIAKDTAAPAAGADARSLYLRGRYMLDRASETSLAKALECFQQALVIDPKYAAAWSGLADVYDVQSQYNFIAPVRGMAEARRAAQKALDLDPSLAEGHISMAAIYEAYDWNWKAAEREYRRAIELNPDLAAAHLWYGMFLRDQGRLKEAMPELERAHRMEPLSVTALINLASAYAMQRDYTSALRHLDIALELAPQSPKLMMMQAGLNRERSGEVAQWVTELERARDLAGNNPPTVAALARAYAKVGRKAEAEKLLEDLRHTARERYVSSYDIAMVYLSMKDLDRALPYLEAAYRERSTGLLFLRSDHFASYRSNPRFRQLIDRMHFIG